MYGNLNFDATSGQQASIHHRNIASQTFSFNMAFLLQFVLLVVTCLYVIHWISWSCLLLVCLELSALHVWCFFLVEWPWYNNEFNFNFLLNSNEEGQFCQELIYSIFKSDSREYSSLFYYVNEDKVVSWNQLLKNNIISVFC